MATKEWLSIKTKREFKQASAKMEIVSGGIRVCYATYAEAKEKAGDYAERHFGKIFDIIMDGKFLSRHKKFYKEHDPVWTADGDTVGCVNLWSAVLNSALEEGSLYDCSIICEMIGIEPSTFRAAQLKREKS